VKRSSTGHESDHPFAQEVELGATVHLPLDEFEAVNLTLDLTVWTNREMYPINQLNRMNLE
jgi:hypothetical protein